MQVSYDRVGGFAYLALVPPMPGTVKHSVPLADLAGEWPEIKAMNDFTLDFDGQGRLVGIEVTNPERALPMTLLEGAAS